MMARRNPKQARSLARSGSTRAPYAKVLIVCEGEKTEPNYFNELKNYYKINSANIVITGDCGSDPLSIFRDAKKRHLEQQDLGDAFDQVYCVFDRDAHTTYADALNAIKAMPRKTGFHAIRSVPCFEYWLLLHYLYTTKPYMKVANKSVCNLVIADLRQHDPQYAKGCTGTFERLLPHLDKAITHAEKSLKSAMAIDADNPITDVHVLVHFLRNIKSAA